MEAYGAEASPMMAFREDKSEAACESPIMTYAHRRAFNRDVLAEAAILTDIYTATAVESSESESEDEQIQESSEMDGASTMVVLHNLALASSKMSEVCRASDHLQRLESGFEGFKCGCARARAKGQQSCLDDFSKVQLRTLHTETYGPPNKDISVAEVLQHIHRLYQTFAVPLAAPDSIGRTAKVGPLKIFNTIVCGSAFRAAVGGSRSAHREKLALTLRGVTPSSCEGAKMAAAILKAGEVKEDHHHVRRAFAKQWWADELRLHDFLPNENAIRFKGPFWTIVYKQCYHPVAMAQSGLAALSYKRFMTQKLPGAITLAASFVDCIDPEHIRVKRSARHSNFPECNSCQRRRANYIKVMSIPGTTKAAVDEAYAELQAHMVQWQGDRKVALAMKDHSSGLTRATCYECDDKCGSQWCELPVASGGRDNKECAKAKFKFGIQCNTVAGGGGVNRFMVVPKHIKTGGNFGLTCFILALWSAHRHGRLTPSAGRTIYRHTDGGPDNLNKATHLFHWLLVWLGIADEFIWFRFDSGHSHTELADRFFSMLKRIFTSNGNERVCTRVDSFEEFEKELRKTFAKSAETVEFEYIFANWDFNNWFASHGLEPDKDFKDITWDNVFRYTYDETCWAHGCVKVTYKSRLTWMGTAHDAEWAPIKRILTDAGERNVTTAEGVQFVTFPPDVLRHEPLREAFDDGSGKRRKTNATNETVPNSEFGVEPRPEGHIMTPVAVVDRLVAKRDGQPEELSSHAKAHWAALKSIYSHGPRPGEVPDMPFEQNGFTFNGCPQPLLPILKQMRRFPRPYLHWDPFSDAPPATWPDWKAVEAASGASRKSHMAEEQDLPSGSGSLRDPRKVNNVRGAHYTAGQSAQHQKELKDEEWVQEFPSQVPVGKVHKKRLYLIQLSTPEGGLKLGFAEAGDALHEEECQALWFIKTGGADEWSATPTFIQYKKGAKRMVDPVNVSSFLLELKDDWLTETTRATKHSTFRLEAAFTRRLKLLGKEYPLAYGELAPPKPPESVDQSTQRSSAASAASTRKRSASSAGILDAACTPCPSYQPSPFLQHKVDQLDASVRIVSAGTELTEETVDSMVKLIEGGLGAYVSRGALRAKKPQLAHKDNISILVTAKGTAELVAFVAFRLAENVGDTTSAYIRELHVCKDWQRNRLGTELMNEAHRIIADYGTSSLVMLTVHTLNSGAKTFYTALKFKHCWTSPDPGTQVWSKTV